MLFFRLVFLSLLVSLNFASKAANFYLSPATLEHYGCGKTCQQVFNLAQEKDREIFGSEFDFDFYATASNFTHSNPGDLLKFEPVNSRSLDVVPGVTIYRFQYTSRSLNGTLVPATGFIGIPYSPFRKDRKYKVIAYAHGTIGVFRGCPPSTAPTLYDYTSWSLLINRGYAVVATDYAGLGNGYIKHGYLSFPAHAYDIYYAMVAARKAFPKLFTMDWMAVGHSQGGGAVWKLSESHHLLRNKATGHYLGTVALAPASKIYDMTLDAVDILMHSPEYDSYDIIYELLWLPIALRRIHPTANVSFVTDTLLKRVDLGTRAQSCYLGMMALAYGLKPSEMFSGRAADLVAPANGAKAKDPLLIIQGLNDTAVLPRTTINSHMDACRYGNEAHLTLYEGMDHTDVVPASAPEWLSFIDAQFQRSNRTKGVCSSVIRVPFDAAHMVTSREVDEIPGGFD